MFERKGVFRLEKTPGLNPEELELELIDHGLENLESEEEQVVIYTAFSDYGKCKRRWKTGRSP
jgi:transcriptional/translational regulatory protein YebC/TACO1